MLSVMQYVKKGFPFKGQCMPLLSLKRILSLVVDIYSCSY